MKISVKQLKQLIQEQVEEGYSDSYGSSGAEGYDNVERTEREPDTRSQSQRDRDSAHWDKEEKSRSDSYNNSSRCDESRRPRASKLRLEALRRMIRSAAVAESRRNRRG